MTQSSRFVTKMVCFFSPLGFTAADEPLFMSFGRKEGEVEAKVKSRSVCYEAAKGGRGGNGGCESEDPIRAVKVKVER